MLVSRVPLVPVATASILRHYGASALGVYETGLRLKLIYRKPKAFWDSGVRRDEPLRVAVRGFHLGYVAATPVTFPRIPPIRFARNPHISSFINPNTPSGDDPSRHILTPRPPSVAYPYQRTMDSSIISQTTSRRFSAVRILR
jgi:hypothetical protein